ncbi:MAG: hypothetical protein HYW01_13055 [Deltaproteobacteria bacterium]|nr:hypothetical protein [Deltaproteobacteria bacterium]
MILVNSPDWGKPFGASARIPISEVGGFKAGVIAFTDKMKRLCHELKTEAIWNKKERYIEVKLS